MAHEDTDDEVYEVEVDPTNEMAVIAAALADGDVRSELASKLNPDHFLVPQHKMVWTGVLEIERRKLSCDRATLLRMAPDVERSHLDALFADEPGANVDFHVDSLLWDHQKAAAVKGPVKDLLEALKDPKESPDRVRAIVRRMGEVLEGQGSTRYLLDTRALVHAQVEEIRERMQGRRIYPYGLPGLDYYDGDESKRRMLPGAAPGHITVVTGVSGGGKSTLTAHLVLGLARQKRRVLFGAWEMQGGMTLELLAGISLGWKRSDLIQGLINEEDLTVLRKRMVQIGKWVQFLENPFRRRIADKPSNARNLDIIQECIAVSGCDVFVADLWERCLESDKPEDEKRALFRQQSMLEELGVHGILLAQQRLKDIEMRKDKRPTREGIKGSSAWVEAADNIIAPNRPALWKRVDDDVIELFILKQRYGRWPLGIECTWDPEVGMISGGVSIEYDRPGEMNEHDEAAANFGGRSVRMPNKGKRR